VVSGQKTVISGQWSEKDKDKGKNWIAASPATLTLAAKGRAPRKDVLSGLDCHVAVPSPRKDVL